jgi:Icc-related predicted phosphoesterase
VRLFESNRRKSITIFDVDDTLVVTRSKIKVHNPKTGFSAELTPQEFNTFQKRPNDKIDFSDFRDLEILKAGKIIEWVFSILRRAIKKGKPVGVITARDDAKLIQQFLAHNGININPNYIFAINDPSLKFKGSTAERKKEAFKKFIGMGFNDFTFYDDDNENIKLAKSLNKEPGINMKAKLIKQKWIPRFSDFE